MSHLMDDEMLRVYLEQAELQLLRELPSEHTLHHRFSRRFRKTMRSLIRHESRTPQMSGIVWGMRTAAAVVAVAVLVFLGMTVDVEAAFTKLFSFFTQVSKEWTSVRIEGNAGDDVDFMIPKEPSYIPGGYTIKSKETYQKSTYEVFYVNDEQLEIMYEQNVLSAAEYIFDTEDAYVQKVLIDEQEVNLIEKNGLSQVYWYDDKYFYTLDGMVDLKELVKMAESIIKE